MYQRLDNNNHVLIITALIKYFKNAFVACNTITSPFGDSCKKQTGTTYPTRLFVMYRKI